MSGVASALAEKSEAEAIKVIPSEGRPKRTFMNDCMLLQFVCIFLKGSNVLSNQFSSAQNALWLWRLRLSIARNIRYRRRHCLRFYIFTGEQNEGGGIFIANDPEKNEAAFSLLTILTFHRRRVLFSYQTRKAKAAKLQPRISFFLSVR
jgi:hypothetical protein